MTWEKFYHGTNTPYKKNPKSGAWYIIDYVSGEYRVVMQPNGNWTLTKNGNEIATFKTLRSAKAFAEREEQK